MKKFKELYIYRVSQKKKVRCLIRCKLKIYKICFYIFWILILQFKIWCKVIQNRLKVRRAMANQSLNFRTRWWQPTRFFRKMYLFRKDILLYLSSLERRSFVKLKKTQLFYLFIKLMKPFAVPRAFTGWKTKRGIGIILFSHWELHWYYWEFSVSHYKSSYIFGTLHRKRFESFVWEVPWFSGNSWSEFHQWLLWVSPLYNIYSLISP